MPDGWIKLHRKLIDNGIMRDQMCFTIFVWLLLKVDRDTGKKTIGRFWASEELGVKPTTFYKALKRLSEKWQMVTLTSNNKFTEIIVSHWDKYQSTNDLVTQDGNNKVTTKEQQSNTLQEVENKELRKELHIVEKISNPLSLSKSQLMAFAREFPGIGMQEIKEQAVKCSLQMAMSSSSYSNPGLYFKGWMKKVYAEWVSKQARIKSDAEKEANEPKFTPEQIKDNFKKLSELKKTLNIGGSL